MDNNESSLNVEVTGGSEGPEIASDPYAALVGHVEEGEDDALQVPEAAEEAVAEPEPQYPKDLLEMDVDGLRHHAHGIRKDQSRLRARARQAEEQAYQAKMIAQAALARLSGQQAPAQGAAEPEITPIEDDLAMHLSERFERMEKQLAQFQQEQMAQVQEQEAQAQQQQVLKAQDQWYAQTTESLNQEMEANPEIAGRLQSAQQIMVKYQASMLQANDPMLTSEQAEAIAVQNVLAEAYVRMAIAQRDGVSPLHALDEVSRIVLQGGHANTQAQPAQRAKTPAPAQRGAQYSSLSAVSGSGAGVQGADPGDLSIEKLAAINQDKGSNAMWDMLFDLDVKR